MPMRMEFSMQMRPEQQLRLSPQMIQSMELLQIPLMELEHRIQQELLENPVLEMKDIEPEERSAQETIASPETTDEAGDVAEDGERDRLLDIDNEIREYREYFERGNRRTPSADQGQDPKYEALANTPAPTISLRDALHEQIRYLDIAPEIKDAISFLIDNLDLNGYLSSSLEELAVSHNENALFSLDELIVGLRFLQALDPTGVGARDLQECLLLQITRAPFAAFERQLVRNHLDNIMHNRLPRIVKETGHPMEEVKEAIQQIQTLTPHPGALFGSEKAPHILPDVVVKLINGRYEIFLEEGRLPNIYISPFYRDMLRNVDRKSESFQYVKKKMESAKWLLDAIRQRQSTLRRLADALIERQRDFLDKGISGLKPLRMQEIADMIHVHVSTVSRAVMDKYIQVPRGIYPMKFFFTGGTATDNGEDTSSRVVKQMIQDLCDKEDKSKPFSDDQIVSQLSQRGITLARRTVTKYRKALSIPSSRERKVY